MKGELCYILVDNQEIMEYLLHLKADHPDMIRRARKIIAGMGMNTWKWLLDPVEIKAVCREINGLTMVGHPDIPPDTPIAVSIVERDYKYGLQFRIWKVGIDNIELQTQILQRMAKSSATSFTLCNRKIAMMLCEAIRSKTPRCCKWPVKQPDGSWVVEKTPPRKKQKDTRPSRYVKIVREPKPPAHIPKPRRIITAKMQQCIAELAALRAKYGKARSDSKV